jgi:hypothetical protein
MEMASFALSSSKNILKIHSFTISANLIFGTTFSLHASMVYSNVIGMKKATLELPRLSLILSAAKILSFI